MNMILNRQDAKAAKKDASPGIFILGVLGVLAVNFICKGPQR
jgi:hypothetical protein